MPPEKRVLIHGAAGGLGTLALQMLSAWGASVMAIARPRDFAACREAGAIEVVDSSSKPFATLLRTFDATLNFAGWDDDLALIGALREGALGHATTVHPLLANFDELGWVRGVLKTLSDKRGHRTALPKNARYAWTVFKPETAALLDLREHVEQRRVGLPIAVRESLANAALALDHVKNGRRGRALILPA
jgi:NADPH:quinone reductase-like Zn-dependent oxidoreductase